MQEYRFKFYLNALHSILINGKMGDSHPHTWEITVDVFKQNNGFISFSEVEQPVEQLFKPFQGQNMNDIAPFDALNPTLENVAKYFQSELETIFVSGGFMLARIEVAETPARSFIIDIKHTEGLGIVLPEAAASAAVIHQQTDALIKERLDKMSAGKANGQEAGDVNEGAKDIESEQEVEADVKQADAEQKKKGVRLPLIIGGIFLTAALLVGIWMLITYRR